MSLKRIIAFLYIVYITVYNLSAQSNYAAVDVVKQFSQILMEYSQTRDFGICGPQFDNLCHSKVKCRVENDLMKRMADKVHSIPQIDGTYLFDTYINEISRMIDEGGNITIENVEYDSEISKLGLVDGKADYVKYDIIVSENLSTENRYTDLAVIRDGKITAIYQYSGARSFVATIKMLLPNVEMEKFYTAGWMLDLSKAEEALWHFRKIASNSCGYIAKRSMEMVVAMEMNGIGCSQIGKYAKKMDIANYFVYYTSCPAIWKQGSNSYMLMGINSFDEMRNYDYIGTWDLYKRHPYINDKGSAYFHYIFPKYRSLSNVNLPYIKKDGGYYGFVSEKEQTIVECKYSFAYPFDNKSELAAVRDANNKWGFINLSGELVIPHIYDVINDVFVDGKNFVIKDDNLILIDKNGVELRKIYGYNYIIPKLMENEIIAYNGIKQQFDAYDFYGNLLIEDCFNSVNMSKKEYARFRDYFMYGWGQFTYNVLDDVNEDVLRLPRIPIKISISDISSEEAVDLGIGTLWASKNLGASSCSDMGELYLWGDYKSEFANVKRTRAKGKEFKKNILKRGIPINIAGTYLDIATQTLGTDWRLPTKEEQQKLVEECVWVYCILNGNKGYRIIGKNGNSIFLPIEGEYHYEPYDVPNKRGIAYVLYWSSVLRFSDEPYGLRMSQYDYLLISNDLSDWNYIRPVRNL